MDGTDLEERFRERVAAYRKEYYRFTFGAAIVTAVVLWGLWTGLSSLVALLGGRFLGGARLHIATAALMALLLASAYLRFRGKHEEDDDRTEQLIGVGGLASWWSGGISIRGLFFFLVPFYLVASLPFFLIREFLTGRHLFASEEASRMAFEMLSEAGDKIDRDAIERKLAEDRDAALGATRLLVEMKLFFVKGKGAGLHLVRTLEGQEFLDARSRRGG